MVGNYIHPGAQLGVLVEVNCESDFVARTEDFQELVKDLAMQIAAADPQFIRREDVTPAALEKEKEIQRARALAEGKPEKMVDKIIEGRMNKFFEEICLYEQPFIKENTTTVGDLIKAADRASWARTSPSRASCASRSATAKRQRPRKRPWQLRPSPPPPDAMARFQRILLKLSGEVLAGPNAFGIAPDRVQALAAEIAEVKGTGVEIGLVVGGGNFFRGVAAAAKHMDRVAARSHGDAGYGHQRAGAAGRARKARRAYARHDRDRDARSGRAVHPSPGDPASGKRARRDLRRGHVQSVFLHRHRRHAAGAGDPRRGGSEGDQVDGVYDKDPMRHADAVLYREVSYLDVLAKSLAVMDASAVAMCRDNQMPILVFNLNVYGNIMRMSMGETHRHFDPLTL